MIQLHPRSLLVGIVLGAIALLTMSQSLAPSTATVRVQYMPHPRDMVQIEEGTPFTVPSGRILVVTGLGSNDYTLTGETRLSVNSAIELTQPTNGGSYETPTVRAVPVGFSAKPGDVVSVDSSSGSAGRAWGYLADQ